MESLDEVYDGGGRVSLRVLGGMVSAQHVGESMNASLGCKEEKTGSDSNESESVE
jgi:hypothetical protein